VLYTERKTDKRAKRKIDEVARWYYSSYSYGEEVAKLLAVCWTVALLALSLATVRRLLGGR